MAHYFILQENNESAAYAFKVLMSGYKPEPRKNQREQFTVTGRLDVQVGPNDNMWNYTLKVLGDESGTFSVTPGSIVTASTVEWGDYGDLRTLFNRVTPPTNKFRMRDMDGEEYWVYFTGSMKPKLVTPEVSGERAYMRVDVTIRGTS